MGFGASAVHVAWTLAERGFSVVVLDVGRPPPPTPSVPEEDFLGLLASLESPERYFLGSRLEGATLPGGDDEYYGFPPHREYIFEPHRRFEIEARGFEPLVSFARGGLAEAWTGGCFPFNDAELEDFPFGYAELEPYYTKIAERIGVTGDDDDLTRFTPFHRGLSTPVPLDEHSERLLAAYARHRSRLKRAGVFLGRSRSAVLTTQKGARKACAQLGRCLWGCPRDALWTPSLALPDLLRHGVEYRPGVLVQRFEFDESGRIQTLVLEPASGGPAEKIPVELVVLAAGTLASSKIVLESVSHQGQPWTLSGLMDNRQILVPFVNLRMIGQRYDPERYQYHQLAMGFSNPSPKTYVHALLTTLKTAMIHPIVQSMPFDLRTGLAVFANVHAALGLLNVNLHDTRRSDCQVTLAPSSSAGSRLVVSYSSAPDERERIREALRRARQALLWLGCVVPPGMAHERPMGASVHYAGLIPMSQSGESKTTRPDGRSADFPNLYLADGTSFPFLPAKNITFTLMANAARIGDTIPS